MGKNDKIKVIETQDDRMEFAKFMRGEKVYENILTFTDLKTGKEFKMPIVYHPATAYMLAEIYADIDENMGVDDQFERMAQMFQATVRNVHFVNVPEGMANYEAGELSVQDLTADQRAYLEAMVAPGVGKDRIAINKEVAASRRLVGKGARKDPVGSPESDI